MDKVGKHVSAMYTVVTMCAEAELILAVVTQFYSGCMHKFSLLCTRPLRLITLTCGDVRQCVPINCDCW